MSQSYFVELKLHTRTVSIFLIDTGVIKNIHFNIIIGQVHHVIYTYN